jgi:hypothetical protein
LNSIGIDDFEIVLKGDSNSLSDTDRRVIIKGRCGDFPYTIERLTLLGDTIFYQLDFKSCDYSSSKNGCINNWGIVMSVVPKSIYVCGNLYTREIYSLSDNLHDLRMIEYALLTFDTSRFIPIAKAYTSIDVTVFERAHHFESTQGFNLGRFDTTTHYIDTISFWLPTNHHSTIYGSSSGEWNEQVHFSEIMNHRQ